MEKMLLEKQPIYLDYNATTPHDPEVVAAMRPYLETYFGNPSSSHWFGRQTKQAVEVARQQVAVLLGCEPAEIIFTSGGTEANNYALKGIAQARKHLGNHIITSQVEHPAIIEVCQFLETSGYEVTYLPVDEYGSVRMPDVERAIRPETILISIMHANNEVGTVQPVAEIAELARAKGIVVHTDAAQSIGKLPTRVADLGVDLLSVAGHKLYAPKGVGVLYLRKGIKLEKFMHGASHENNLRAGTENVLEIVGLGKACEVAGRDFEQNVQKMSQTRNRLYNGLVQKVGQVRLNGHPVNHLPNTLSLSFKGLDANVLIAQIEDELAVSAGAACHSGTVNVSHVLRAMAIPIEWARGTIRFSTGKATTAAEIDRAIEIVSGAVANLTAGVA